MNVLIIGSGGREHALAWKVAQSPRLTQLYIAPGNPGTMVCGENIPLDIRKQEDILRFCKEKKVDLVVIGPEIPLASGLVDVLSAGGVRCFGPKQAAAQIEASKVFAKNFMLRQGIPTARYATFTQMDPAVHFLESADYPIVIKASGLAAGKGVILPDTPEEAKATLEAVFIHKAFGDAGREVVIEERLYGQEVSLMAFADGTNVVPMLPAQDHKRLLDGDQGPNTGGMGAYAPAPIFTAELMNEAVESVLKPAVRGLQSEGYPFIGVLYAGLILTSGGLKVLEFNCRFGDPETQVVLPLLKTDLLDIIDACIDGTLAECKIQWNEEASVCVVLASQGYPERAEIGKPVTFSPLPENMICFHAGTKIQDHQLLTSGGRVFGLTCWSEDLASAIETVYSNLASVSFDGLYYRTDIGCRALEGSR